jgi:hypothetical protein
MCLIFYPFLILLYFSAFPFLMIFNFYIIKKSHFKNFSRPTTNRLATHQFRKRWSKLILECSDVLDTKSMERFGTDSVEADWRLLGMKDGRRLECCAAGSVGATIFSRPGPCPVTPLSVFLPRNLLLTTCTRSFHRKFWITQGFYCWYMNKPV